MRLLLCALLAFLANPAGAEWVKYGESDFATFYLDPETVRKEGNLRRVWEFQDLKKRDDSGALSLRFQWEIACNENLFRRLAQSAHSESRLEGILLVLSSEPAPMIGIGLGSNIEAIRNRVCAN